MNVVRVSVPTLRSHWYLHSDKGRGTSLPGFIRAAPRQLHDRSIASARPDPLFLCRVRVADGFVDAAAGQPPGHSPGLVLGEAPAMRLLGLMMSATKWRQIAFARCAAAVEGHCVIKVAAPGSASAARERACSLTNNDQVPERLRRLIAA